MESTFRTDTTGDPANWPTDAQATIEQAIRRPGGICMSKVLQMCCVCIEFAGSASGGTGWGTLALLLRWGWKKVIEEIPCCGPRLVPLLGND